MNRIFKMKAILWVAFSALMLLAACSKDDEVQPVDKGQATLNSNKSELVFGQEAAKNTLHITSNRTWTATSSAVWCKLSSELGEGDADIVVSVTKNTKPKARKAQIILSSDQLIDTIEVTQFGEEVEFFFYEDQYLLEKDTMVLGYSFKRLTCHVMSNVEFVTTLPTEHKNWIVIGETDDWNAAAYDQRKSYLIFGQDNFSETPRYTKLTIWEKNGEARKDIVIRQEGFKSGLEVDEVQMVGSHFKCVEFLVTRLGENVPEDWSFSYCDKDGNPMNYDWLHDDLHKVKCKEMEKTAGQRYYLRGSCDYNTSDKDRMAYLKLQYNKNGQSISKIITICQLACNGTKSDSLVLINLVSKNAVPIYGLNLTWNIAKPVTEWYEKCIWDISTGEYRVKKLIVSNVWLCYDLTAYVGNLSEMNELNVSQNYLRGDIPAEIGLLDKLESLDISDNYIGPEAVGTGPSGEICGIENVSGEIFRKCKKLKSFVCSGNRLTRLPDGIQEAENLTTLELGNNNELDGFPEDWSGMKSLKYLNISNLKVYKGGFFNFIFTIPTLENFNCSYVEGFYPNTAIPDEFEKLPNLKYISLINTNIAGPLPRSLAKCKKLQHICFTVDNTLDHKRRGNMTGTLPEEYGYLDSLQFLTVANNHFEGGIPESYANLLDFYKRGNGEQWFFLSVEQNSLSGQIPEKMVNHPVWQGRDVEVNGVIIPGYRADIRPEKWVCPQRENGFSNCE